MGGQAGGRTVAQVSSEQTSRQAEQADKQSDGEAVLSIKQCKVMAMGKVI